MAVYDLEEQEQLAALKAYWKLYGNLILTVLTVAFAVIAAFQAWNYYQRRQAAEASMVYGALQRAQGAKDAKQIKDLAGTILERYPRTYYAAMAALISAKSAYESGDAKSAKAQLEWVAENAKAEEFRYIARLRLAGLLLDEKDYDGALKLVDAKANAAFAARFADLRGDILAAQKKNADARSAYQAALNAMDRKNAAFRQFVQQKLDSLGGAS
jgi:predicted negative regulator of RcsB-dependent stress response